MSPQRKPLRRQIFVFTPDEKRAAACVVGAFLLGLGTMYYRATHPRPKPTPSAAEQQATKHAASRARSARPASRSALTPAPVKAESEDAREEE